MNVISWYTRDRLGNLVKTKIHVTRDGLHTFCSGGGLLMPKDIIQEGKKNTPWQEIVTCYNCAYRLGLRNLLGGYEPACNSNDFPLRRAYPDT